ncbi:MAG: universal stress protein [Solirubrobacteraceae bacterium]
MEDLRRPSSSASYSSAHRRSPDEGQEHARQLGLAVQVRTERNRGALWQTILDIAAETNTELIIIGTRGTTDLQPSRATGRRAK